MEKPSHLVMKKTLFESEVENKLMKQTDPSGKKNPRTRERHPLLKAIFSKLKREDVV